MKQQFKKEVNKLGEVGLVEGKNGGSCVLWVVSVDMPTDISTDYQSLVGRYIDR